MKKILLVTLLVSTLFLVGCNKKEKGIEDINPYTEITYNELTEKIENKDDFSLYIGSANCGHCANYTITLKSVVKRYPDLEIFYIDTAKLAPETYTELATKFPISGTPTTVIINAGEELNKDNRLVGSVPYEKITKFFRAANYID